MAKKNKSHGQATIEYLFVLVMVTFLTVKMAQGVSRFLANSLGGLGVTLSDHLSVGSCANLCLYGNYMNGR